MAFVGVNVAGQLDDDDAPYTGMTKELKRIRVAPQVGDMLVMRNTEKACS